MVNVKRTWSIKEKITILEDIKAIGVVEGCRKHGIYATTYYDWKKKYDETLFFSDVFQEIFGI